VQDLTGITQMMEKINVDDIETFDDIDMMEDDEEKKE